MKTVLEFGAKGSRHVDNQVLPTLTLGKQLAYRIAYVLGGAPTWVHTWDQCSRKRPRIVWESETHFVALSILDGNARGSASSTLWTKA